MIGAASTHLDPEKEYEIVNGQPVEKQMGWARHGGVTARLIAKLGMHVKNHKLGGVYGPDTSFQIGQNERIPDVAFIAAARISAEGEPKGIWPIAPDLAVEIISPADLHEKMIGKVREYFTAGVRQVWLVSPGHRFVTIYEFPTQMTILSESKELVSDDILPGFRCPIRELL